MGMDVYGKNPTSVVGNYFRSNIWYWRPLWAFCCSAAPTILSKDIAEKGTVNEGHGLDAEQSALLSAKLLQAVQSGKAAQHEKDFYAYLQTLPQEKCPTCPKLPALEQQDCLYCKGAGVIAPTLKHYRFSTNDVTEFAQFLRHCGGFEIW
jgi:hypothetical protein